MLYASYLPYIVFFLLLISSVAYIISTSIFASMEITRRIVRSKLDLCRISG